MAVEKLRGLFQRVQLSETTLIDVQRYFRQAQILLHFHPDRLTTRGSSVAEGLLTDGIYRNQYDTGISSGSPTAYTGGFRDTLEEDLFGGAYHQPGNSFSERPKYGALDLFQFADGAAPRFGSCYLVLHSSVAARCTFSQGDSAAQPAYVGTWDVLDDIIAALFADVETHGAVHGMEQLPVSACIDRLAQSRVSRNESLTVGHKGRALDSYIEAQIHGDVDLSTDVTWLVADSSFRGTPTGMHLEEIGRRYAITLGWHPGFRLHVRDVPDDFRGQAMPSFARHVADSAGTEVLTAAALGVAAASLDHHPESWSAWGSSRDVLRLLRQLWHVLVQYG